MVFLMRMYPLTTKILTQEYNLQHISYLFWKFRCKTILELKPFASSQKIHPSMCHKNLLLINFEQKD